MKVAVLIPTKGRASQMQNRVGHLISQKYPEDIELLVVLAVPYDDYQTIEMVNGMMTLRLADNIRLALVIRPEADSTSVQGSNRAYQYAREWGADWYMHGHDDLIWSRGWLDEALRVAEISRAQVIGFNDLHSNLAHYAPFWLVKENFLARHFGGLFVPPKYQAWWFDREICEKAAALGMYAPAPKAIVEHTHPDWHTAEIDATYDEAMPARKQDRALYLERKAHSFPVDYGRVLI